MPVVKLDRIISVSSEDPNYKGENILSSKKWRSKTVGEDQVSIVIQLSKPSLITAIGNFTYIFKNDTSVYRVYLRRVRIWKSTTNTLLLGLHGCVILHMNGNFVGFQNTYVRF